jgi:transcriptional regulator with XRE-family HTH domain
MRSTQDPALLKAFAAELKARRAVLGLNQEELGFASGLNRTFIAKLETAGTSPSLTSLVFLCKGLAVEPSEFMHSLMQRYKKELRTHLMAD